MDDDRPVLQGLGAGWNKALQYDFFDALRSGSRYELWVTTAGADAASHIGRASSTDDLHYEFDAEPALTAGSQASAAGISCPAIVDAGDRRLLLYAGTDLLGASSLHLATWEEREETWLPSEWNPILSGTIGGFDEGAVQCPDALYEPPFLRVWYSSRAAVGYAEALAGH